MAVGPGKSAKLITIGPTSILDSGVCNRKIGMLVQIVFQPIVSSTHDFIHLFVQD